MLIVNNKRELHLEAQISYDCYFCLNFIRIIKFKIYNNHEYIQGNCLLIYKTITILNKLQNPKYKPRISQSIETFKLN